MVDCKEVLRKCLDECKQECLELGLDVECRMAYRDCLGNPSNYEYDN